MTDDPLIRRLWSRRAVGAAVGPGLLAACAETRVPAPPARRPLVSVNLLDTPPPPTPPAVKPGDAGARLEAAFDQARRMAVPVFIDGRGPFAFVVDTGANRSVVSQDVAAKCALPHVGRSEVHGIAGVEPAEFVGVHRLRVGSVSSTNLELPILPHAQLGADGLLGVDVLYNRRMLLDFRNNRFEIAPSTSSGAIFGEASNSRIPDPSEPVRVPAQYRFGQLVIVDAQVGDVRVSAFLDSGSQVTVGNRALRDAVIHTKPEFGERLAPIPLISATGQTAEGEFAELPAVRLGGLAVRNILGVFAQLHIFDLWALNDRPTILIGIDVMRHFEDVTMDFARREVIFRPLPPGERPRL